MTEPTEPTTVLEPTDSGPTPTDTPAEPEAPAAETAPEQEPSPNSEAARWRTKLRDAEAQISALTERITGYQRKECEAAVADVLEVAGDLWELGGVDVAAFYDDAGELNEEQLRAAAGALVDQRPRLAKPRGPSHHNFGQFSAPPPPPKIGWGTVIGG